MPSAGKVPSNRRAFPRWPLVFEVRFAQGKDFVAAEGYEIGEGTSEIQKLIIANQLLKE